MQPFQEHGEPPYLAKQSEVSLKPFLRPPGWTYLPATITIPFTPVLHRRTWGRKSNEGQAQQLKNQGQEKPGIQVHISGFGLQGKALFSPCHNKLVGAYLPP